MSSTLPVLAFLHADPETVPAGKTELDPDRRKKLDEFRTLCRQRMCTDWSTQDELAGKVAVSLIKLVEDNPGVGWIRADQIPDEATSTEVLRLTKETEGLKANLKKYTEGPPPGTERLAQGEVAHKFVATVTTKWETHDGMDYDTVKVELALSWDEIFAALSTWMLSANTFKELRAALESYVINHRPDRLQVGYRQIDDIEIDFHDFAEILTQLRTLGLVQAIPDDPNERTLWKLTDYGMAQMGMIKAIPMPKDPKDQP